jgi:hypothetical protein
MPPMPLFALGYGTPVLSLQRTSDLPRAIVGHPSVNRIPPWGIGYRPADNTVDATLRRSIEQNEKGTLVNIS